MTNFEINFKKTSKLTMKIPYEQFDVKVFEVCKS